MYQVMFRKQGEVAILVAITAIKITTKSIVAKRIKIMPMITTTVAAEIVWTVI